MSQSIYGAVSGFGIVNATIRLNQAQIFTLNSAPKVLVASPGAKKMIVPVSVTYGYTFGTVAYAGASGNPLFGLVYGATYPVGPVFAAFFTQEGVSTKILTDTASNIWVMLPSGATGNSDIYHSVRTGIPGSLSSNLVNQPLIVTASMDYVNGDGSLDVALAYYVVNTP